MRTGALGAGPHFTDAGTENETIAAAPGGVAFLGAGAPPPELPQAASAHATAIAPAHRRATFTVVNA